MLYVLGAVCAPCCTCTMLYVYHAVCALRCLHCVVHEQYFMYTDLYVPCAACCIWTVLCTYRVVRVPCCTAVQCVHCAAHAMYAMCIAAPARCLASTPRASEPLSAFVEAGLAKTQCENHKQQLTLMRTSHRRVSTTAEGRAVFYHEYVEMEITTKSNNSSGICDENERGDLFPGLIQISKHIFRWENSQDIVPKEDSNGRGEKRNSIARWISNSWKKTNIS